MIDMTTTIAPKSNQLNADDLLSGPRTIKITKVSAAPSGADQPVAINFEGDNGKPYYPCKSMRRVLVQVWDKYAEAYVGRSLTLYRDPAVLFGGIAVGGIRISHMSHIDRDMTMALAENKKSRKPFTVKPLKADAPAASSAQRKQTAAEWLAALEADLNQCQTADEVGDVQRRETVQNALVKGGQALQDGINKLVAAALERTAEAAPPDDDAPGFDDSVPF